MRREEILRILAQFCASHRSEFGIVRLGVFDSAARDELTELSDVDIVVELAQPDLLRLVGIKQELEALLQRPVDVVCCRERMNPFLKQRIDTEAVYV